MAIGGKLRVGSAASGAAKSGTRRLGDRAGASEPGETHMRLNIAPIQANTSLRDLAYDAIKKAITEMDIYGHANEVRLDERQLSEDLGVSRTPIREALTILEQEGFVRSVPRRGIFVVRKSKAEIIEMITVWAALESMAARLAAERATSKELRSLRNIFEEFEDEPLSEHMNEYSEANIAFHQTIIKLSKCPLIAEMTGNLFIHVRAIRNVSLRQAHRAERSIVDHQQIIDALEARDAELAERLDREHTLGLAAHVEKHGIFHS
jgi:DNA-binding GntR family transcriptional regulator